MALFKPKPKTSKEKAQKAQFGIFARLVGCAYLVYIIVKLLQTSDEDEVLNETLKIIILIVFSLAAVAIVTVTIIEFIRSLRAGYYKADAYTDDTTVTAEDSTAEDCVDNDSDNEDSEQNS